MSQAAKLVYIVLYEGVQLLDVAGPAEVLAQANSNLAQPKYKIEYVGSSACVTSSAGLVLSAQPLPALPVLADILVVPGADLAALEGALADEALMGWLSGAVETTVRKTSVCTGAFLLGHLGLLDDRRVTTHWMGAEMLQASYPAAKVEPDVLYIRDGDLWTSAGVLSGVDMALAMVREDLGETMALTIARQLIVFLFRDGGQSQFSGPIDLQTRASRSDLAKLISWLESKLAEVITVETMASYMAMSPRNLHRKCIVILGFTPARLLTELRLERGRALLHEPKLSVKAIALSCGFANGAAFSKAFSLRFGLAPLKYKQRFQAELATV